MQATGCSRNMPRVQALPSEEKLRFYAKQAALYREFKKAIFN
jgi:hypothetical protein